MTKAAKTKADAALVATTGLEYQGRDGRFHRVEAGDQVAPEHVDAKALRWLSDAGFLAQAPQAEADTED
jgi:hypothetical protein